QLAGAVVTGEVEGRSLRVDGPNGAGPIAQPSTLNPQPDAEHRLRQAGHRTLKKVTHELERFGFNTAIAALMEYVNTLTKAGSTAAGTPAWEEAHRLLTLMLAPLAPHMAEEMWERLGEPYSVHQQAWPQWDEALA